MSVSRGHLWYGQLWACICVTLYYCVRLAFDIFSIVFHFLTPLLSYILSYFLAHIFSPALTNRRFNRLFLGIIRYIISFSSSFLNLNYITECTICASENTLEKQCSRLVPRSRSYRSTRGHCPCLNDCPLSCIGHSSTMCRRWSVWSWRSAYVNYVLV